MITQQRSSGAWRLRHSLAAFVLLLLGIGAPGVASAGQWTIGTGTNYYGTYASSPPPPLGMYYSTMRVQYLYTAAELTAAGVPVGTNINQIGFNVATLQGATVSQNMSIYVDTVPSTTTTLTSSGWAPTSTPRFTNGSAGTAVTVGWNYFTLNSNVYWNGTSNIVVDVCNATLSGAPSGNNTAGVYYNTASGKSLYRSQYSVTASLCGLNAALPSTASQRPNIRFVELLGCTGHPDSGKVIPAGTTSNVCPGAVYNLSDTGYTRALGLQFAWQKSTNGGTTWTWIANSNSTNLTTPPILSNTRFRFVIICTNTSDTSYSLPVIFNTVTTSFPVYSALPMLEGFESWINGCSTSDLPSNKWTNRPSTGYSSLRREDQGSTAGESNSPYAATVPAIEGSHSARYFGYYSFQSGTASEGALSAYADCSATTGPKELQFYYNMPYPYGTQQDSIIIDTSTDAGATFGRLSGVGPTNPGWNQVIVPFNSNSATTVVRLRVRALSLYQDDVYLDDFKILPSCTGKPTAGKIDTLLPCNGTPFQLSLTGTSTAAGLTYQWQYMPAGALGWSALPGGNIPRPTATITSNTSFRVIVTCTNSGLSDTSLVAVGVLQPFYYCYCSFVPQYTYNYNNIGNVLITSYRSGATLLNNGIATPTLSNTTANRTYTDFRRTVAPPTLIRDSVYRIQLSVITSQSYYYGQGYPGLAWLDSNRDGVFQTNERILNKNVGPQSNPTAKDTFRIRRDAKIGLTGLRVAHFPYYSAPTTSPCGTYGYQGEIEDYLVRIDYQPCTGPLTPGYASISDTSICPGYTVDMWDTAYQTNRTGLLRAWETSTNNGASWSVIPGSLGQDTLRNVVIPRFNPVLYRFRVRCANTTDTTYSNVLRVTTPEPVRCYAVAQAAVGGADSSDIGAFRLGSFVNPAPPASAGPHLLNPVAHRRRTDYTLQGPIFIEADSSYRLSVFHTMPGAIHSNARVSVFIDFNNDLIYQPTGSGVFPPELIYTGVTDANTFFLDTVVTMPHNLIPNVRTGVRVIISNDVSSSASNPVMAGAGTFQSGEVEDYIAYTGRRGLGIGGSGGTLLQALTMYPNPTTGKFTVTGDAARSIGKLDIVVTTITGQQVMNRSIANAGAHFTTDLDLTGMAKGVYFVELHADGEKITRKLVVR